MTDFKMTFTDEDFGDAPKPKMDADDLKFKELTDKHLEKTLPKMVDVYNLGKAKDFSAKQANLAKYATYGSETYGKLGFDPFKAGGVPGRKSGMDALYDDKTHWSADIGRAFSGAFSLAGIGLQDTIGLGAFADSGNYLDFEDTMGKYSSSRGGNAGFWSNTLLSSGYTAGIIGGIALEEIGLAAITAATGGAAAPGTVAAGGTALVRGVTRIKEAGNMLKFVNKLQDINTASGFVGKLGASAKGFAKALNPLENTMDFVFTADKLKDLNGWKQTALGAGAIVRDARKISMSHSESKLEADMARKEFTEKMYDDYYKQNPSEAGKPISKEQASRIEGEAQKVHDNIYAANFGLIYATNAITFDNMLKSMRGTNKFFANAGDLFKVVQKEGGKVAVDVLKKNVWNYGRKKLGEITWQGALKSVASSSMEGFQELGQDVISESVKSYRERNVKGLQLRGGLMSYLENDLTKAASKQISDQGLSTFLSGAMMGVFASPVGLVTQQTQNYLFNGGVNKTYQYVTDREGYKKEKLDVESKRKERAKTLTNFFNNNKNFIDAWSKGIYTQSELQEQILTAGESGDQKTMKNKQHESFVNGVHTLLESGMENQFADHLEYMAKNFNAQQLNEIFGKTDITEENKDVYQKKLQHQADNIKQLRAVYNEIQSTINNPINIKNLDINDPDYLKKLYKFKAVENLKKELLFSHSKIADRANRQKEIRTDINKDSPLTTLEINALLDESDLTQQIQLLKTEVDSNSKLSAYGDSAVQNQAQARAKLKAYQNYQEKLNAYKAEQKNEKGSISESDTFDELFDAYNNILEVSGKNKLINSGAQREFNKQQFNKVFDYLALNEENRFNQELIDTILNPTGSSAFIEGQEEMLKRLEENKEDHILSALYEFDKKAVSDDMLNDLYNNDLFFDLQELDDLLNKGLMPKEIFDITTNKLATPEQYEAAQKIINSYIKKLKGKTITNDKTQLNKQGRKLKSDKRTIAGILRQYRVKLNEAIKLSSPEGQRLLDKLMAAENKYLTKLDREILSKLGEQDVTVRFVTDNTLPVQLTEDGVIELDIRFAGSDYLNSAMSFENLIVTGLTQHAITEKLKNNDDMYLAARNAMEQAKKAFKQQHPMANVDELSVFEDVNVFMTEAMNDMQFQKFLATVEDTVQPTSKSLWSTLSTGIENIVEETFDKKLANRVINIAAKALDDSIVDNIAESNEKAPEVTEQREAATKEKVEELQKLAKELGERWNVNVQVLSSQEEADKILNNIQDPFYQKFSTILNDLLHGPTGPGIINLRKGVADVSLTELLKSVYDKSESLSELINNLKELSVYQTNGKVAGMVDWLVNNADNIGDGIEMVKNIFFQAEEENIAGFYDEKTNTAYIVANAVKENTLYHEIFLHPFLINLEKTNPEFYKQLVAEARASQEIVDYVEKNYGTEDKIGSRQFEHELVGRAYDLSVSNKLSEKKEAGLFKKIGQFIKRMLAKVAEFLKISKNDVGRFNPRKTTISDLAEYSVNSNDKVNLGKIIEADKQAQSTEATTKPRTRKKTVKSVRTVLEEQTVNKGGNLIILDNASDSPEIFADFLHPEIVSSNNLAVAEWTQKLVDLGQELDDARITNWVYGNVRAQVGGRLIIDVTAEVPVFVKKALKNKKANPKVKALQDEIAALDKKIQGLSSQRKTAPVSDTTAQEAEIERRRQEELKERAFNIEVKRTNYTQEDGRVIQVRVYADGSYKTYALTEDTQLPPAQIDEGKKEINFKDLQDIYGKNLKIEEQPIKTGQKDKINAKYDAELEALKKPTSTTTTPVADIEAKRKQILDKWNSKNAWYQKEDRLSEWYAERDAELAALEQPLDNVDKEIEATLKERNTLQDQLNAEDQDIIEEGEETVQQGTKKVKFLMYKSTGQGSTALSAGEWVPLLAIGTHPDGREWFVKAYHNGEDPKFNKYGSSVFADIDKDLKVNEELLFGQPENWVTETVEKQVEEETEIEEEIPVEEQEAENKTQDNYSYQSKTEILNDLDSIENEIKKLNSEYEKVTTEINNGKLSIFQKRKAKNKQNLLAIDINDLYQQLNNLKAGLSQIGEDAEVLNAEAQYVPVYDYNGNEVITDETPWLDIPQELRTDLAALYGKALNKLDQNDIVKIKAEMHSNPIYISAIAAHSKQRLEKQDAILGLSELQSNNQKIEEEKLKIKAKQEKDKLAARQAKKEKRLARPKVTDEDILKGILKGFDYSILTPKEIKNLVAKLKDKSNALIDFTVNDIIAYITDKQIKKAEKEQKLKNLEDQKEQDRINKIIKNNFELLMLSVIPYTTSYGKKVNLRIPKNGMAKFISTYHPEIFALPKQKFLDAVNDILNNRISQIKYYKSKDFGFVRDSKTTHRKLDSLFKKLEKEKKLFPEVVNKINLALYNANSKFRIRATRTGKNSTMSSMYVIQKVNSTKRITPPGVYAASKNILGSYKVNTWNPSNLDLDVSIAMYFLQGGKIKLSALEDIFGKDASELKDWKNILSEKAGIEMSSFDGASLEILKSQDFNVTSDGMDATVAANALEGFISRYYNLSSAAKALVDAVKKAQITSENEIISDEEADDRLFMQEMEEKGMTSAEAAEYLSHLKFLQTEEGQAALNAESKFLDDYYNSQEFELLNDEFSGNEDELSDEAFELKAEDVNEEEEEEEVKAEEEILDRESLVEQKDILKENVTQFDKYYDELVELSNSLNFSNVIEYAWDSLNGNKKSDIVWAAAVFKLVNSRTEANSEQKKDTQAIIAAKISNGHYKNKMVLLNNEVYRIVTTLKGRIVLQNQSTLTNENLEFKYFLDNVQEEVLPNTEIKKLNIDSIVKVQEFDYIKGAYNDILNNFTTYMGEANSLSEDKLISSLKEETTKCK